MKDFKNFLKQQLEGGKLIDLNNEHMTIQLPNNRQIVYKGKITNEVVIDFVTDDGDWCGYAEVQAELKIDKKELKNNPIITNIKIDTNNNDDNDNDTFTITLVGLHRTLAEINGNAGSGSGWAYGAFVDIRCKALHLDHTLCAW